MESYSIFLLQLSFLSLEGATLGLGLISFCCSIQDFGLDLIIAFGRLLLQIGTLLNPSFIRCNSSFLFLRMLSLLIEVEIRIMFSG